MNEYNSGFYHKSHRLKEYDYSNQGIYFITICISEKSPLLGKIINHKTELNEIGIFVEDKIKWIPSRYNYIEIIEYCIMPNHIHLLLKFDEKCEKRKTVGGVIGAFKTVSTKQINDFFTTPGKMFWQSDFYDHIVRNEEDLFRIQEYIKNNPLKWELNMGDLNNKL